MIDPATIAMLAKAGIDVGKMLFDAFKKKPESPGSAAQPWLDKAAGLYEPLQQQGQGAYGQLNPEYSQMAQDPGAYYEKMLEGYEPSRAYQLRSDAALKAAQGASAAGGMSGSLADRKSQAGLADTLLGEDMQNWFNNVSGLQNKGLQGLGHFYDTGVGATSDLANTYGSQANLAMLNEMFKQMASQQSSNGIFGGLSDIAGSIGGLFGGGSQKPLSNNPFIPNQKSLGIDYSTPKINMGMFPGMGGR